MAGETTGLVIFSHRSVFEEIHGPAYSRLWRPGYLAAALPYWSSSFILEDYSESPTSRR